MTESPPTFRLSEDLVVEFRLACRQNPTTRRAYARFLGERDADGLYNAALSLISSRRPDGARDPRLCRRRRP
ncbi:MAG: hypothetical protein MZU97_06880 [Bacillus subtilis]|nr:hypothetical protein [Bacillus subtilis]